MVKRHLGSKLSIPLKDAFTTSILLFNSLSWLYIIHQIISTMLQNLDATYLQSLITWGLYDFTLIGSGIVGSIISSKIRRLKLIYSWMLLNAIVTLIPIFIQRLTLTYVLVVAIVWSISLGLGMPSALAYFADFTISENRGRMSGMIFFLTNLSAPAILMILGPDLASNLLISSGWRALGLLAFLLLKPLDKFIQVKRKEVSFKSIFNNKLFLFYLTPWLMFSLIDGLEKIVFENFLGTTQLANFDFLRMIGAIFGTVSALIGGILCDIIGRKRMVIYGFVSLGLAYAVIGIASTVSFSWYFYSIIDGIAWGIFTVCFVLILWGDLAPAGAAEKYYAIGAIPFFSAEVAGLLFVPQGTIPAGIAFSVASFFLFLSVLPLMYAQETLPQRRIELRQLKGYIEQAKKTRKKYVGKSGVES